MITMNSAGHRPANGAARLIGEALRLLEVGLAHETRHLLREYLRGLPTEKRPQLLLDAGVALRQGQPDVARERLLTAQARGL